MNWHERYLRQAAWTRELRTYLFEQAGISVARHVLEVGCGTGAVLASPPLQDAADAGRQGGHRPQLYGLDIAGEALDQCRLYAPAASLVRASAIATPFPRGSFDITYCHFLLLWISDPVGALQEMKRVTVPSGYILVLAEPDYGSRTDEPEELAWLGQRQNEALKRQGAALRRGAELGELFHLAEIHLIETGALQPQKTTSMSPETQHDEWEVLENDLAGSVPAPELERIKGLDSQAWARGERILDVPTYYAWGQV